MLDQVAPKSYIYIYAKLTFWGSQKSMILERFLDRFWERFWRGFWRGFGEVFKYNFDIINIYFSYYFPYRVGKDSGRDLKVILIVFGWLFYSFSVIWEVILGWFCYYSLYYSSTVSRQCEAHVKKTAKPTSVIFQLAVTLLLFSSCCHVFPRFQLAVTLLYSFSTVPR